MNDDREIFNQYASQYKTIMDEQLGRFSKAGHSYFIEYKINILREIFLSLPPNKILDYGSGIGLTIPYLASEFPNAEICATDISQISLDAVSAKYPTVRCIQPYSLPGEKFDLIFLSGVVHHIPSREREKVFSELRELLTEIGKLVIFEHNPYNPLTQYLVRTCPFDKNAELLSMRKMQSLLRQQNLEVKRAKYTLFIPPKLSKFVRYEAVMGWFPMGAQYYVIAEKR